MAGSTSVQEPSTSRLGGARVGRTSALSAKEKKERCYRAKFSQLALWRDSCFLKKMFSFDDLLTVIVFLL